MDEVDPVLQAELDRIAAEAKEQGAGGQHERPGITEAELDAVIRGLAPPIRKLVERAVSAAVAPLQQRIAELEQRIERDAMGAAVGAIEQAAKALQRKASK
jgi:hypothetical protein